MTAPDTWRKDTPCRTCVVAGCTCGCPTCRKAEEERKAGTRTRADDWRDVFRSALQGGEQ